MSSRWLVPVVCITGGAVGVIAGGFLLKLGLEEASQWASILGFVLAVPAIVLAIWGIVLARREAVGSSPVSKPTTLHKITQWNKNGDNNATTGSGSVRPRDRRDRKPTDSE